MSDALPAPPPLQAPPSVTGCTVALEGDGVAPFAFSACPGRALLDFADRAAGGLSATAAPELWAPAVCRATPGELRGTNDPLGAVEGLPAGCFAGLLEGLLAGLLAGCLDWLWAGSDGVASAGARLPDGADDPGDAAGGPEPEPAVGVDSGA